MDYKSKYLKYKNKYLDLKNFKMTGGSNSTILSTLISYNYTFFDLIKDKQYMESEEWENTENLYIIAIYVIMMKGNSLDDIDKSTINNILTNSIPNENFNTYNGKSRLIDNMILQIFTPDTLSKLELIGDNVTEFEEAYKKELCREFYKLYNLPVTNFENMKITQIIEGIRNFFKNEIDLVYLNNLNIILFLYFNKNKIYQLPDGDITLSYLNKKLVLEDPTIYTKDRSNIKNVFNSYGGIINNIFNKLWKLIKSSKQ